MTDKNATIASGERLHTLSMAAERLSLSIWTLRSWVQTGRIESNKLGGRRLIAESEIQRLIETSRVPATAGTALMLAQPK